MTALIEKLAQMQMDAEQRAQTAQDGKIRRIAGPTKSCNGAQPTCGASFVTALIDKLEKMQQGAEKRAQDAAQAAQDAQEGKIRRIAGPPKSSMGLNPPVVHHS